MQLPALIVFIPWLLSLVLEFWLIGLIYRRRLYREVPVFSSMVIIYALLDVSVLLATITRFHQFPMFTLREIASVVLRTWLLMDLSRKLLSERPWTKLLMITVLVVSATLLIGVGFPVFLNEHTAGIATTYLHLGVWFRTAYFAQVGVISILFLINFSSVLTSFTREIGMAIGLATCSAAELVSMTLRGRPGGSSDVTMISLNYIGMVTASAIWLMFMYQKRDAPTEKPPVSEIVEQNAYSATGTGE